MATLPVSLSLALAILAKVTPAAGTAGTAPSGTPLVDGWCDAVNVNKCTGVHQEMPVQRGWDPVGLVALATVLSVAALYLAVCDLKRRRAETSRAPLARGAFRVAAARGEVVNLDLLWRLLGAAGLGSVDAPTSSGFTALHAAAAEGHAEACLWLCQKGADVSAVKNDGWRDSPLHMAAASGSLECCKVLLAHGADPTVGNFAGHVPASVAARNGYASLAAWLEAPNVPSARTTMSSEQSLSSKERDAAEALLRRSWDGAGSEGTVPKPAVRGYRIFATLMLAFWLCYLVWRALFTLRAGWWYWYSIPMLVVEAYYWLDTIPMAICLGKQIQRPGRKLSSLVKRPEDFPSVDVIVTCCSEPVDILAPTVIAARNMNYPADRLAVYVCDDGGRDDVKEMVARVRAAVDGPSLHYIRRDKRQGFHHHAKAGSINSCLLKEGTTRGSYVLVLDSDMVVLPDFLESCMGHFYKLGPDGNWVQKQKCAFLQTPQDFWNIPPSDKLEQALRMFFGPVQKGRDGCGAVICCGTGVIFNRAVLVSVGGQSYGSIAEDLYTGMELAAAGFSSMYLTERLVSGMAPDDIKELLKQRQRWATGLLQIIFHSNPLCYAGLTALQRINYFNDCIYPMVAVPFLFSCLVPLLFLFSGGLVCPVEIESPAYPLWQCVSIVLVFYAFMELALWWALAGEEGMGARATTERMMSTQQTQQSYWLTPAFLKALWHALKAETGLGKLFCTVPVEFAVTAKSKPSKTGRGATYWDALATFLGELWPLLAYVLVAVAAIAYWAASSIAGNADMRYIGMSVIMVAWTWLVIINVWPALTTLLPGWSPTQQGWKIMWVHPSNPSSLPCSAAGQPMAAAPGRRLRSRDIVAVQMAQQRQPHASPVLPGQPTPQAQPEFGLRKVPQCSPAYFLNVLLRMGFLIVAAVLDGMLGTVGDVQLASERPH